MRNLAQIAKALYAALAASLGALAAIMVGDVGFTDVSDGQWIAVVLAGLVAGGGVFGIPNAAANAAR